MPSLHPASDGSGGGRGEEASGNDNGSPTPRRRRRRGGRGRGRNAGQAATENPAADNSAANNPANAEQANSDTREADAKSRSARRKRRRGKRSASNAGPGGNREKLYAALDLGTNNCRLLIARRTHGGFKVVDAFSRIVRLGEGVAANGRLSDQAMDRAVDALRICAEKMDRRGVARARSIATAACRSATNGPDFIKRVKKEAGLSLEIVSTEDEAHLALAGCAPLLDRECEAALVFDIGGGSTELIWVEIECPENDDAPVTPRVADWMSLPHGVVTLAEKYGGEEVSEEVYRQMVDEVAEHLDPFAQRLADRMGDAEEESEDGMPPFHLLGTSGTVTTIAGVMLGLKRYDRTVVDGIWISPADVHRVTRDLMAMDYGARAKHPCVGEERADLVLAGCAIFEAIAEAWPSHRLRVADRGLREGILLSMMEADASRARRRRRRRRRKQKANRQQGPEAKTVNADSE